MSITKNGSAYYIRLYAGIDLSTASDLLIAYTDPEGTEGTLSAVATGDGDEYAQAAVPSTLSIIEGHWRFEITCTLGGVPVISYETATVRLKGRFA
jgi:hypothetical protein